LGEFFYRESGHYKVKHFITIALYVAIKFKVDNNYRFCVVLLNKSTNSHLVVFRRHAVVHSLEKSFYFYDKESKFLK